ncbi:MAG: VCBS repeat-containing protein, partial [Planctomycetota bacterium]|nr:VCBS repeat-containing protein [Planctomycetota bacterium]
MGVLVADYDCDGRLDIYAMYQSPAVETDSSSPKQWVNETMTGAENQLWRNIGGGKFENTTRRSNAGGGKRHSHAASWFFYDDDHYPDLYIANDFGRNVLLRNKGDGTFEDLSSKSATAGYSTSMGVSTGDLNNDGLSEIY